MPPYKEQGVVLRSVKLGEADKIVTVMTQGSGKVRAVAKGIRKTTSRFGARLEPFTHVSLMLYRGRGSLDTITQAEIIAPHLAHPRGPRAVRRRRDDARGRRQGGRGARAERAAGRCSCSPGLRALDTEPADPGAVAESFMLKLLSLSGFHPALTACAVCGAPDPQLFSPRHGRRRLRRTARRPASAPVSRAGARLACSSSAAVDLIEAGDVVEADARVRQASRAGCSSGSPSTTWSGG